MKLSDMGTTGLIQYVVGHRAGRSYNMARVNAERVISARYSSPVALSRFRRALLAASMAANAARR